MYLRQREAIVSVAYQFIIRLKRLFSWSYSFQWMYRQVWLEKGIDLRYTRDLRATKAAKTQAFTLL